MRTLYTHAYQSYIWNFMVTERIKEYGLKPVVGDLVLVSTSAPSTTTTTTEKENEATEDDVVVELEDTVADESSSKQQVILLTSDNVSQYTIYDVVMPLPGMSIQFPQHKINQQYFEAFMAKDGITMDMYKHGQKYETNI